MRRLPPLGAIQAFVHAARLGSMKAAAESLALSAPALSRRVQALEQAIGVPLFDRTPNGAFLNDRGAELHRELEPFLEGLSQAFEKAKEEETDARIRLAVPSLFASQRLLPAIATFREREPRIVIDVDTGANRISRLGGDIDVAIAITDHVNERYDARILEAGSIIAIGSDALSRKVRTAQDLVGTHILLHRDMPNAFEAWCDAFGVTPSALSVSYFDAGQLILDAAAEGLGVAFMLESHLTYSADSRLVKLLPEAAPSPYAYWLACLPSSLERRPVRQLRDWLAGQFGQGSPSGAT